MTFGEYGIIEKLGAGGMGTVYLARGPDGEPVALKVLQTSSGTLLERFEREVEITGRIEHTAVVKLLDAGYGKGAEGERLPYYAMEYVPGRDLETILEDGPKPGLHTTLDWVQTVAEAIGAAHDESIVHRDLKPANILIDDAGHPRVTDFGLARFRDDDQSMTQTGTLLGTMHYMAPEQFRDAKRVGPPADVFSLGAILYRLLTGTVPFEGTTPVGLYKAMSETPEPPSWRNPAVHPAIDDLCLRTLDPDPSRRPPDGNALARALASARSKGTNAPSARLVVGGLLAAGLALGGWVLFTPTPEKDVPKRVDSTARAPVAPNPDTLERLLDQALARHRDDLKNRSGALELVQEARTRFPDSPKPLVTYARIEREHLNLVGALAACNDAIDRDPLHLPAILLRGHLRFLLLQNDDAERDYETAIDLAREQNRSELAVRAVLRLVELQAVEGRFEAARETCRKGLNFENAADLHLALARLADLEQNLDEAATHADKARTLNPESGRAHLYLAVRAETNGHLEKAERLYTRAIELDPTDPEAHARRGSFRITKQNDSAGFHDMDRAWELEQKGRTGVGLYVALVRTLLVPRKRLAPNVLRRAEEYVRRALYHHRRASSPHGLAARFHWFAGDPSKTLHYARKGLEHNLRATLCWFYLGMVHLRVPEERDPALAIDCFEKTIEIRPTSGHYNILGIAHFELGHPRKALDAFNMAIEKDPDHRDYRLNRARVLEQLGQPEKAARDRRMAR